MVKWSFSSLKDFTTCARQYNEVRVKKNFVKQEHISATTGKAVHVALESFANNPGQDVDPAIERYTKFLRPLLEIPGQKFTELRLGLDANRCVLGFEDEACWVRGIIDLLILQDETAYIIDYKTGNDKYADLRQLKLMALLTFGHFPEVATCKVGLLFLNKNNFIPDEYHRDKINFMWQSFEPDLKRLEYAFQSDKWIPNPSGLCRKHCPVTTCEFHGRR